MAKDSFFIRAKVDTNGINYAQAAIDLGAYVDALGSAILRVHNLTVQYGSPVSTPGVTAPGGDAITAYQLTTQSQVSMVDASHRSLISSGKLVAWNQAGVAALNGLSESSDILPQDWTNGYLIATEQIYLGTDSVNNAVVDQIVVVMECTVEKMTPSAAMALALSQS
jgi:hypothetical protein